jgi:hypothetical protein
MDQENQLKQIKTLRELVQDYLRFRVWFDWQSGKRTHIYGEEWGNITLSQVRNRRVPQIILNREAGYADCINLCEKYHGQYRTAKIYSGYAGTFTKLHRVYKFGDRLPADIQDPVITEDKRILVLDYSVEGNVIKVFRTEPAKTSEISSIDFKKELQEHLQPSIPGEKIKSHRTKKVKAANSIK